MIIKTLAGLDLNQYRRLFVFGCSLSQWRYPTWADILAQDVPHCDYFNLAYPGAGSLFLQAQYSQWTSQHTLTEQDLVIVQWPTFYREDRYRVKGQARPWVTPGNIFSQDTYPPELEPLYDRRGFAVRDFAIQDLIQRDLERSPATALCFNAVDVDLQDAYSSFSDENQADFSGFAELYPDVFNRNADFDMLRSLSPRTDHPEWSTGYVYVESGEQVQDYHPTVEVHARFLTDFMGAEISEATATWSKQQHQQILEIANCNDFDLPWMRHIL